MNVNSKTGRIKLDKTERRQLDHATRIATQLAHFMAGAGQQSAIAKTAATALSELCQQLDGNEVDERQLAEVK